MASPSAQQRAQAALIAFGRVGRLDDQRFHGIHQLGESPHDAGYQVRVSLAVMYEPSTKTYATSLVISEKRYESGLMSVRHEREMPIRRLATAAAGSRFSAKRVEQLYNEALAALRKNPQPLIDLLQEESERS